MQHHPERGCPCLVSLNDTSRSVQIATRRSDRWRYLVRGGKVIISILPDIRTILDAAFSTWHFFGGPNVAHS
jgi:hypothetical protein